jgi:hypothetical protein
MNASSKKFKLIVQQILFAESRRDGLRLKIVLLFVFLNFNSFAQKNTSIYRGTLKISNAKDTVYVKASTSFIVYPQRLTDGPSSYKSFVKSAEPAKASRIKVIEAHPQISSNDSFDYSAYFNNNPITRDIRMRTGERDTVKLMIYVDKKGRAAFTDLSPTEIIGKDTVSYSMDRKSFKFDRCHKKTQRAFRELILETWTPAEIQSLRTHPSKRKKKYSISKAYMQGVLTVIYSSAPIED